MVWGAVRLTCIFYIDIVLTSSVKNGEMRAILHSLDRWAVQLLTLTLTCLATRSVPDIKCLQTYTFTYLLGITHHPHHICYRDHSCCGHQWCGCVHVFHSVAAAAPVLVSLLLLCCCCVIKMMEGAYLRGFSGGRPAASSQAVYFIIKFLWQHKKKCHKWQYKWSLYTL